jgi:hypothetical protein
MSDKSKDLNNRPPELTSEEKDAKKLKESLAFPNRHQNGAANVYRQGLHYRDNSSFVGQLFNAANAICFTRPMQLGKTTLFSLADELFSVNKTSNIDTGLSYSPGDDDRNKWYVLRLSFGSVRFSADEKPSEGKEEWVQICKDLDKQTKFSIKQKVILLLSNNEQLNKSFVELALGEGIPELEIGSLMSTLSNAVLRVNGRLLILVDEYDQPFREGLLRLIPEHGDKLYESVRAEIKKAFCNYFAFFGAVKDILEELSCAKIWLTGITPIGIREMSGLNVKTVTFQRSMANAVGLTEADVSNMLDSVHNHTPFQGEERERVMRFLKQNFNNLRFPYSEPLYHTALVNSTMNMLLDEPNERRDFLRSGSLPSCVAREPVPSSVFNVLSNARNLRRVVNELAERREVTGYTINEHLSLEYLLKEIIDVNDYLTLLVHIGVISATGSADNPTLTVTSGFYVETLLEPLLRTLRASVDHLLELQSTEDLYDQGEDILVDFVTSISKNNMTRLMAWAASDDNNHILELQFQSQLVTEAHAILEGIAKTTQEDTLPASRERTDVTFASPKCVVILELKQVATGAPTANFISKAHKQLAGYVKTRRNMEAAALTRPVVGFIVVMYSNGAAYVVEKLRGDSPN